MFANDDLFAPIASGSSAPTDMVIIPCSMGTLARIAHGTSSTLIERAADVMFKQKRNMVLVPRETPLSVIHLKNMTALAEMGAHIVPATTAFYNRPKTVEEIVDFTLGRVLDLLKIEHKIVKRWRESE